MFKFEGIDADGEAILRPLTPEETVALAALING